MRRLLAIILLMPMPTFANELPRLSLVQREVTISGLSSGAAMTAQLETAFSSHVSGVGIIAGAPFGCAEGRPLAATSACMKQGAMSVPFPPTVDRIASVIQSVSGSIDPVEGMADDRVYLFHGTKDSVVSREAMDLVQDVLEHFGVPKTQIVYDNSFAAPHSFLTTDVHDCLVENDRFLNACGLDMAGAILNQLELVSEPKVSAIPENLETFEQAQYFAADDGYSMSDTGYVYIPSACRAGQTCRLHIALHGCLQGDAELGNTFPRTAGYNEWAEANHVVVLYPQVGKRLIPRKIDLSDLNPLGCWDWWGYSTGSTEMFPNLDYLTKNAPQMATIAAMTAALGAPLTE